MWIVDVSKFKMSGKEISKSTRREFYTKAKFRIFYGRKYWVGSGVLAHHSIDPSLEF